MSDKKFYLVVMHEDDFEGIKSFDYENTMHGYYSGFVDGSSQYGGTGYCLEEDELDEVTDDETRAEIDKALKEEKLKNK